mmetsp:Transcript_16322/g.25223  ORF Transcript_16322/g.25223 Transcript_16322/m.25223 type:complete len:126 (-) Transcript_16322:438-815(-)
MLHLLHLLHLLQLMDLLLLLLLENPLLLELGLLLREVLLLLPLLLVRSIPSFRSILAILSLLVLLKLPQRAEVTVLVLPSIRILHVLSQESCFSASSFWGRTPMRWRSQWLRKGAAALHVLDMLL